MGLRVFVVDDEAPARSRLRGLIRDCAESFPCELVGEADSGLAALKAIETTQTDVVLLDIRMPGMDGLETAQRLAGKTGAPTVIFVTAYDAHALAAFEVGARDYLLKPVRLERLLDALKRVKPNVASTSESPEYVTVNDRGRVLRVPMADVLYLRAELKYVTLRTREREYVLDDTLAKLEEAFPDLLRIHRNCLVNRAHLLGFELGRDGEEQRWLAILKDWPESLSVSRRQIHVVKEFRQS